MDKDVRNTIGKMTLAARRLLEMEYAQQLEGTFDILPDGTIEPKPGSHLDPEQRLTRDKLVAAIGHKRAGGMEDEESVDAWLREAAFTTLNRFAGLKMAESRGIVLECVSRGDQSAGFKEFGGLAPGLVALPDHGYRVYLECIFDELSVELGVLFDRRDPASLLWPRRKALEDLLDLLNADELNSIWAEDETIGWIYQYFNGDDKKAMRDASAAPRNSRELAVRNQFFTPRYVVEFLSDNTLGRIWYEMRHGDTKLKDQCRYMVRRPNEAFLLESEDVPAIEAEENVELSQDELLNQPVHIPFRPKKDPRELRVLDPACGSGHFLLYCFELLETIYREAWDDPNLGEKLQADFQTEEVYRRQIPVMILENNLHGIEIDARCAQIASLALWLRVKKAYQQAGIAAAERPPVRKSNIVVAEPMPGEKDLLKDFTRTLDPPLLGQIVENVWDAMELAGEAGSLLKIEEQITEWVKDGKKQWQAMPKAQQMVLFESPATYGTKPRQGELELDVSGISDEDFWEQAEERIYTALREYAERSNAHGRLTQRLFADDAARGFALIHVCRNQYDICLMNPPFGEKPAPASRYLVCNYPAGKNDIYGCFLERMIKLLGPCGLVGAITSRTWMFLPRRLDIRTSIILRNGFVHTLADLGHGVLDSAMVETCAFALAKGDSRTLGDYFRLIDLPPAEKEANLYSLVEGRHPERHFVASQTDFAALPGTPFAYWVPHQLAELLRHTARVGDQYEICPGMTTRDNDRFLRSPLEVPACSIGKYWRWFAKGGSYSPYSFNTDLVINYHDDGKELKAWITSLGESVTTFIANQQFYFQAGLTYPRVTDKGFNVRILRAGHAFAEKGISIFSDGEDPRGLLGLLGYLNSSLAQELMLVMAPSRSWEKSFVASLPALSSTTDQLVFLTQSVVETITETHAQDPANNLFRYPSLSSSLEAGFTIAIVESNRAARQVDGAAKSISKEICSILQCPSLNNTDESLLGEPFAGAYRLSGAEEYVADVLEYMLGCTIGRWNIGYAIGDIECPELPDLFGPLPVCPPGMLQNATGLPAEPKDIPADYPLRISWPGILVDDASHPEDIVGRIREALSVLWKDSAEVIEQEACDILGVKSLREYFAASKYFFDDHIKRYSKSRRKAPIYWMLATPSAGYAVWLYYHRFNKDTFYRVLNDLVEPKLKHEERKLNSLRQEHGHSPTSSQRKDIDTLESFVAELTTFRDEVARIAPLWDPNLNDGVVVNYSPLWRLVPQHKTWQKACKACWDKLAKGEYDWAHLAIRLWPERVVPKCAKDRSLAIAHGLDEVFWEEDEKGKPKAKKVPKETVESLIQKRTSPGVKAALNDLLSAPAPAGGGKRKRSGGRKKRADKPSNLTLEL